MIIRNVNPNLRERFVISPWFQCLARSIVLQVDKLVEVFNPEADGGAGAWEELRQAHEAWARTIDETVFIDPETLQIVPCDAEGAVPVLGLMLSATAAQIGIADLDAGSIYEAMAGLIEGFATVNNIC